MLRALLIYFSCGIRWLLYIHSTIWITGAASDLSSTSPPEPVRRRYLSTNESAREAFLKRKTGGLNLSDRVWRYSQEFKTEIEMGIDLGIRDGKSAQQMARDLKQYLQHPDKLFRRVRDEHGMLHLSKRAADFHPGRGVYRSSYLNARRLAATETNMAYRTADHERWQKMDFVVGIEIHLSSNHTCKGRDGKPHAFTDICDQLQGKYPKDFKFTGWHPHCRCYATSILKTDEEIAADTKKILNGEPVTGESENRVEDVPDNFKDWVEKNEKRIAEAGKKGTLPGFVRENEVIVSEVTTTQKGHKPDEKSVMTDVIEKVKQLLAPMARKLYVAFEPFSPIISEMMAKLRDNKKKLSLFRELLEDERVVVLKDTGNAKTVMFPGHKGKTTDSWNKTKQMAFEINNQGECVVFLPEIVGATSADAVGLFKERPVVADFKYSGSTNWNTLQKDLAHGFEQAGTVVLKLDCMDAGNFKNAIDYLIRNKVRIGNLKLLNQYGKILELTSKDMRYGAYKKKVKGFL